MEKKDIQDITFTWKEGRYLDLWILPHMMSGCIAAFAFLFVDGSRALSYGATFLMIAGWELVEGIFGVKETQENRVLDVIAGIVAFGVTYEIGILTLGKSEVLALLIFSLIIAVVLCLFGWLDWRQREDKDSNLY